MSFLYEKQTRRYMIFVACMGILLFMLAFFQYENQKRNMNQILLIQNEALVSALLENGVTEEIITTAYQKPEITQAGQKLTYQLGITKERADKYVPSMKQNAVKYVNTSILMTDRLAMSLRSKEEEEHQGRIFMKDTISDISHQLKTPLAALHMYNEIVAGEPENQETVIRFTNKSAQALTRMDQLIQSLLKVTRLDAGSITFSPRKNRKSGKECP